MFGRFDTAQLQRGFQVYKEVCSACHSMKLVAFRNLAQEGGPDFSAGQVKALAATYQVKDGPNDAGDMFERPGRPADTFPPPFPNDQAAAAANGGKAPPDFSVHRQGADLLARLAVLPHRLAAVRRLFGAGRRTTSTR